MGGTTAQNGLPLKAGLEGRASGPPPGVWGQIKGATVPTRGLLRVAFRGATAIWGMDTAGCFSS